MENEPTMDELLDGLGIDPTAAPTTEDPVPGGDPPPGNADPNPADPAPATDPAPAAPVAEPDKTQQAFVYLRQQNQSFKNTLKGVAEVLGIDPKTGDADLIAALQTKVTENQAQRDNVPVEMLQRLQTLEARNTEIEQKERERATLLGLQQVKTQFGLTDNDVTKFTQDLITAGKNPLESKLNLVDEYRITHFEDIMKKATEDAVAKEQARASKASASSSTPDTKRGDPGSSDGKITTQIQLNSWLDSQVKK